MVIKSDLGKVEYLLKIECLHIYSSEDQEKTRIVREKGMTASLIHV